MRIVLFDMLALKDLFLFKKVWKRSFSASLEPHNRCHDISKKSGIRVWVEATEAQTMIEDWQISCTKSATGSTELDFAKAKKVR